MWNHIKFVTGNSNKVREAGQILGMELEQVDIPGLHEIQTHDVSRIVRYKIEDAFRQVGGPVMVEDSGLIFSAWNGLPGALVKWFEVTVGCEGLLKMLAGFENREAWAHCHVALHDGQEIYIARGEVRGTVAESVRGENGFGWDVIFIPDGYDQTYAEMKAEEKNRISHRRRAFEQLKAHLKAAE